jgi:hypothetical protein
MKHFVLATLLVFLACKAERAKSMAVTDSSDHSAQESRAATPAAGTSTSAPAKAPQQQTRMIIRNASMSLVVRDAAGVLQQVTTMVDGKGGYVADTKQWKEREQVRANATLRIPATELMPVLAAIRGMAIRVESESVNAQDVSQEFSDLNAQLRNLQAAETELRELLKTVRERTQKASEIM